VQEMRPMITAPGLLTG
nr:immunoglobulin heavy chain junction region [Mus musculus]